MTGVGAGTPRRARAVLTLFAVARFLVTGGLSFLVDLGIFAAAHYWLRLSVPAATTLAYVTSFAVNFLLNRRWVFRAAGQASRQLVRYLVLVAVNYVLTLVLMLVTVGVGVEPLVAKALTTALIASMNFVVYRAWVFR